MSLISELKALSEKADERREKRRDHLHHKWAEKEVILNAQLLGVSLGCAGAIACDDVCKPDGGEKFCHFVPGC